MVEQPNHNASHKLPDDGRSHDLQAAPGKTIVLGRIEAESAMQLGDQQQEKA